MPRQRPGETLQKLLRLFLELRYTLIKACVTCYYRNLCLKPPPPPSTIFVLPNLTTKQTMVASCLFTVSGELKKTRRNYFKRNQHRLYEHSFPLPSFPLLPHLFLPPPPNPEAAYLFDFEFFVAKFCSL